MWEKLITLGLTLSLAAVLLIAAKELFNITFPFALPLSLFVGCVGVALIIYSIREFTDAT